MASSITSYASLEPTIGTELGVAAPSFKGTPTSFYDISVFAWTFSLTIIGMAVLWRLLVAGGYRMQASEANIRKSNEIAKKAVLGFLGVFGMFILLFTVNKGLITGDVGLADLAVKGGMTEGVAQTANPPSPATGSPSGNGDIQGAINADAAIRQQLRSINITVNKPVCPNTTATDCTTVGGLPAETISMLSSLRSTCGGEIMITGGTEPGHSSHGPNLYPVDIGIKDSTLNACISSFSVSTRNLKRKDGSNLCKNAFQNFGFVFCDENNAEAHWHVLR
jgi:hypothetical protein